MTTTAAPPAVSVEYPFPLEKGAYVARIVGPHGRYGLEREFLEPETQNKKKARAVYRLEPGWYVTRTVRQSTKKPNPETVLAVDASGRIEEHKLPADRDELRQLGKAGKRGENVDTPGAYAGRLCWCGAEATHHQPATNRARCLEHYKPPADELEPPPPPIYDPEPDYDPLEEARR